MSVKFLRRPPLSALSLSCLATVAWAQNAPPPPAEPATPLADVTNTATRTERRTDSLPATVSVHTGKEAEARGQRDLKDLFRDEVDLAVRASSPRFTAAGASTGRAGNEGLNIRGLEGNQVLVLVDGVRAPLAYSFGPFASGRLDTLFVEALAQADVLRGPASTSFGSDGLAGALSLRLLEPADLLRPGRDFAGFARYSHHSVDEGHLATGAAAWRQGAFSVLLLASRREAHESETQGQDTHPDSRRTAPNPLNLAQTGALAQWRLALSPAHTLGGTLEAVRRSSASDVLSARTAPATPPAVLPATAVVGLAAQDRQDRKRGTLLWKLDDINAAFIQQAEARFSIQDTRIQQRGSEDRLAATDRLRVGRYAERITLASAQASHSLTALGLPQRLSAGLEASRNDITALRDGTVPPFGERFPSRPFPDTRFSQVGAFVQNEIQWGRLAVIPALRFDRYDLKPKPEGYSASTVVKLSDQAVTPRLGLVWALAPALAPYAQAALGFRAPTPEQVNNGFTNVASGYRSIGNAKLKPEHARSLEVGLRGRAGAWRWQAAAYDNRYRDFISQQVVGGSFTVADPAVFQFVNLDEAHIRGAELRLGWTPSAAWRFNAAAAAARGDSERNGVRRPLNSVEPTRLSLSAQHESGAFSWRAQLNHARAKAPDRIDSSGVSAPLFAPPAWTTLDLGLSWRASPMLTLHANLNNTSDETYWRWSDARGLAAGSPIQDAFSAPGRHWALTARLDF